MPGSAKGPAIVRGPDERFEAIGMVGAVGAGEPSTPRSLISSPAMDSACLARRLQGGSRCSWNILVRRSTMSTSRFRQLTDTTVNLSAKRHYVDTIYRAARQRAARPWWLVWQPGISVDGKGLKYDAPRPVGSGRFSDEQQQ